MSGDFEWGSKKVVMVHVDLPGSWHEKTSTLNFMNDCFSIYYNAKQQIFLASGSAGKAMSDDLEDAITDGSGLGGLDDFEDAIEYVEDRHRKNKRPWWGDSHRVRATGILAPKPFHEFASALRSRGKALQAELATFHHFAARAEDLENDGDWQQLGALMATANLYTTRIRRFTWLLPESQSTDFLNKSLGGVSSITDAFAKIDLAARTVMTLRQGNVGDAAIPILQEAVGMFSILGGLYSRALGGIPGYKAVVNRYINRTHDYIRRAH